jgi:hypothetical protein
MNFFHHDGLGIEPVLEIVSARYPQPCHSSKTFYEFRSVMPSGRSMGCGEAAKGERIEGFFFTVSFVALAITLSLVKCVLRELALKQEIALAFFLPLVV